jgi:hypothetical protein
MKKRELKTKMVTKQRDGTVCLVLDDVLIGNDHFVRLENYDQNFNHSDYRDYDIINIYKYNNEYHNFTNDLGVCRGLLQLKVRGDSWELIWERNEIEEMTLEEVCSELGKEIKIIKSR